MKSDYVYKMALRNIGRNKRRTILSFSAIAVAVIFVCFAKSYITGVTKNIKKNVFLFESGHIKILNKDFVKEEKLIPLDLNIWGYKGSYKEVIDKIKDMKGIKYILPRTRFVAILPLEGKIKTIMGMAIDYKLEEKINPIKEKIVEGRLFKEFAPGQYEMVIGKVLADDLKVKVGDKITLMAKTAEEGLGHMTFKIVGIVSYGIGEVDKNYFFIPLSVAAKFLKMENEVGEIDMFLNDSNNSISIAEKINKILESQPDNPYKAYPWEHQKDGQYYKFITMADKIYNVIYIILLVLASLVIINTTMMVIYERLKEIGTISSLGMRPFAIVRLFFYEALIISVIGSFVGTILGGILSYLFSRQGINIAKLSGGGTSFQVSNIVYPHFGIDLLIFSFLFGVIVTAICVFIPSLRVAKIEPVKALRGEI